MILPLCLIIGMVGFFNHARHRIFDTGGANIVFLGNSHIANCQWNIRTQFLTLLIEEVHF